MSCACPVRVLVIALTFIVFMYHVFMCICVMIHVNYKIYIRKHLRKLENLFNRDRRRRKTCIYIIIFAWYVFSSLKNARTILSRNCAARNNQNEKLPVCLMSQHAWCVVGWWAASHAHVRKNLANRRFPYVARVVIIHLFIITPRFPARRGGEWKLLQK